MFCDADFGLSKSLAQNEQAANSSSRKNMEGPGTHDGDVGLEGHEVER